MVVNRFPVSVCAIFAGVSISVTLLIVCGSGTTYELVFLFFYYFLTALFSDTTADFSAFGAAENCVLVLRVS